MRVDQRTNCSFNEETRRKLRSIALSAPLDKESSIADEITDQVICFHKQGILNGEMMLFAPSDKESSIAGNRAIDPFIPSDKES